MAEDGDNSTLACEKLVKGLQQLNADLEVPSPKAQGHDEATYFEKLPIMAEQALASGSPQNNPRIPTATEIVGLYEEIWA